MYIHEAIKAVTRNRPCIRRRAWDYQTDTPRIAVKIQPTDSPDGCVIRSVAEKNTRHGWQPTASDLVADDWETVRL